MNTKTITRILTNKKSIYYLGFSFLLVLISVFGIYNSYDNSKSISSTHEDSITNVESNAILPPIPGQIKYTNLRRANITDVSQKVVSEIKQRLQK